MKIQVVIKVSEDLAQTLQGQGAPTSESQKLLKKIEELGILFEPMHPGAGDTLLDSYFIAEVLDSAEAERVIDHLLRVKAVEAAYFKPPDEMP